MSSCCGRGRGERGVAQKGKFPPPGSAGEAGTNGQGSGAPGSAGEPPCTNGHVQHATLLQENDDIAEGAPDKFPHPEISIILPESSADEDAQYDPFPPPGAASTLKTPSVLRRQASMIAAQSEDLAWLNKAIKQVWPHANAAIKKFLVQGLFHDLNDSLPWPLKNTLSVDSFELGEEPPALGPISAYPKQHQDFPGFEVDVTVVWRPVCDIRFFVLNVPVGIRGLELSGTISVVLRPLLDELPVVGGFQVFLINPPHFQLHWQGATTVANFSILASTLRSLVQKALADALVLPNRVYVPIAEPGQIDLTRMQYPRPEAVLRFRLHAARNLRAMDFNFFGQGSSDPYATAKVGARSYRSAVVKKTLHPVWKEEAYDFFLFNKRQLLNVQLFDQDMSSADDFLGGVELAVGEVALGCCGGEPMWLPLELEENKNAGEVQLELTTLELVEVRDHSQILKCCTKRRENTTLCLVQVEDVRGVPKKFDRAETYCTVDFVNDSAVGYDTQQDPQHTPAGVGKKLPALMEDTVPPAMQALLENLHRKHGLSVEQLAAASNLSPTLVADILTKRPSFDTCFHAGLRFLLGGEGIMEGRVVVKLYVMGGKGATAFAEGEVSVKEIFDHREAGDQQRDHSAGMFVQLKVIGGHQGQSAARSGRGVSAAARNMSETVLDTISRTTSRLFSPGGAGEQPKDVLSPSSPLDGPTATTLNGDEELEDFLTANMRFRFFSLKPITSPDELSAFYHDG